MSEAKHTPGPWKLHNPAVDTLSVHTPAGSIAEWPTNYCPQDLANARLIAASPLLLSTLESIERLAALGLHDDPDQAAADFAAIAAQARSAIDRATTPNTTN